MLSLEEAFAKYPPTVPSRCSPKLSCIESPCPTYVFNMLSSPDRSAVQFQLTYGNNRATYSPCYFPVAPHCRSFEELKPKKVTCCCLKWFDCTGKPVLKCHNK